MEDQEAVRRLRQGDIGGLESLVQRYQLQAVHVAYLITREQAIAEDVVQDAFLQAYRRIEQFDMNRPFGPWFLRIVANNAVKAMRRDKKQIALSQHNGDRQPDRADTLATQCIDNPELLFERAETSEAVLSALDGLSPAQRAVIVQKYYLDMSEAEMVAASGSAPGTIKWHLHRARKRLQALLGGLNPQDQR
ncbi:MAG: RNA polymerase sigma factor [Chloroflexales bacterium]|nr:RNA polymerase sigma factor [Chloroflexales bacterium]